MHFDGAYFYRVLYFYFLCKITYLFKHTSEQALEHPNKTIENYAMSVVFDKVIGTKNASPQL
jgi:hypothetical protein